MRGITCFIDACGMCKEVVAGVKVSVRVVMAL